MSSVTVSDKLHRSNGAELLDNARAAHDKWNDAMESKYSEDDVLTIESFMAHFHNVAQGFGQHSVSDYHSEQVSSDPDGVLEPVAAQGWQLFHALIQLERQYPAAAQAYYEQEKQSRGCSSKFRRNCNNKR